MKLFQRHISKDQSRDTGMAMVLLFLILFASWKHGSLLAGAMALHILNMTAPLVFRPVAVVWLGLSHFLGSFVSIIVLTVLFFAIVTPIGVLRRLAGKDSLKLLAFKTSDASAMVERNHKFVGCDLEKPY